ncbi:protein transport protein SFT2-like [Pistacia vera]|uniref:protein transport protein SFT2-like n=1 Tax=Pistacia vera TaxID=55513 RepID=UPI0012632847|nr:protein transport protein SFT2-like [Pistacia vera]
MQKTAQAWFTGGPSTANSNDHQQKPSSLLADWNSYASSQESDSSAFDLEAAVLTTTDKVSGTYFSNCFRVSKGVRELPGSFQSATSNVPSGKSLMYFSLLLAAGVFFVFIAFTMFLPVIVLVPQKFAICFTVGCALIVGSLFALKGPKTQLAHMFSKERLPFTLGSIGSMVGTIYVSMVLHSYILSVLFSVFQVVALSYYAISYFPGGSFGLKFMPSSLTSSILRCFGR